MSKPGVVASSGWRRHATLLRRVAAMVLIGASAVYVYRALAGNLGELGAWNHSIGWAEASGILAGALGTLVLSTIYHVIAVGRFEQHRAGDLRVGLSYALGQVLRYVPGKVFGILFQISFLAGRVRGASIALALLVQTFYDYAWTLVFVGSIVLCRELSSPLPLAILVPALGLVWWVHSRGLLEQLCTRPRLLRRLTDGLQPPSCAPVGRAGPATVVLALVWIPLLLGLAGLVAGSIALADGLLLGALYLLSAVLSLLAFVVPSGLVVREALFLWLGARYGFDSGMLVVVGLVARIALTAAELLNVGVFLAASGLASRRGASHGSPKDRA